MDVNAVLQQVDAYFMESKGEEAEKLMLQAIKQANEQADRQALLQLLNELLGYYREISQVENSYKIAEQVIALAESMGLKGSIPYATTLLNVANAYRAGGRLQESLALYLEVRGIYEKSIAPDNILAASLENNMSLLYQEMQDYSNAKMCLLRALVIVESKSADFEIAVTCTNLASTCMQLGESEEAYAYANRAIEGFRMLGVEDAHYGAALAAMGSYYYYCKDYAVAKDFFEQAQHIMEVNLGKNDYYYRLQENRDECEKRLSILKVEKENSTEALEKKDSGEALAQEETQKGLALCREYYECFGKPMIAEKFPDYQDKIAVGLVGEGSDCFGYDDEVSRDHDWGPGFCMWVTEETYAQIGEALQKEYEALPREFKGFTRTVSPQGRGRRGVMTISSFYRRLLQAEEWEEIDWQQVSDASLAAAVNGEVFRDEEGCFSAMRRKLLQGYPEHIFYLKLAESCAKFAQAGQYNYSRMKKRGDSVAAQLMLADGMREAMKVKCYLEGIYPPHDKWLYHKLKQLPDSDRLCELLELLTREEGGQSYLSQTGAAHRQKQGKEEWIEQIGTLLASALYQKNVISDTESYLDAHTEELLCKAALAVYSREELVEKIAKLEFQAFDKVHNVGGRASCQNDWATFSIMRKSQYLTWNRTMLLQYFFDFQREFNKGHNLITEKYGRMMESTAPEEYEQIKKYFPEISPQKQAIINEIVAMQVVWMEEFAMQYPCLAENARSVRASEDNLYNTSYETYLRGEISTYSDKMLELYGRYVVEAAHAKKNLAYEIMTNSVHLYGYQDLEAAEHFLAL